jgi:hypothetical protein
MTRFDRWAALAVPLLALPLPAAAQQPPRAGVAVAYTTSVSSREATLEFQMAGGGTLRIAFAGGQVMLDGKSVGPYAPNGPMERSFRELLQRTGSSSTADMLAALKAWQPQPGVSPSAARSAVIQRVTPLSAVQNPSVPRAGVTVSAPLSPELAPAPAGVIQADSLAQSLETLTNRLDQNGVGLSVRERRQLAQQLAREAASLAREQSAALEGPPSVIGEIGQGIASLLGAFAALAALGFGFTYFAPRQLEVVADTAVKSFGRSFFTGLFAQPLVPVVFGLLMLGLALTIIGIPTVPVAAIAVLAVLAAAGVGGYLGLARAAGELYLRRRMASGDYVGSPNTYRFLLYGIGALLAIWVPAVLLGWIPVMGPLFVWIAALSTWVAATVGFGAVILSRGGVLGTFGRPAVLELTDEYLWAARTGLPARRSPRSLS